MASTGGACEYNLGQMPLDLRVATFLAGIQAEPTHSPSMTQSKGSTTSEQHSSDCSAERQENDDDVDAYRGKPRAEKSASRRRLAIDNCTSSRVEKTTSTRKRRYRDDRQKLSNCLAQKRYRERKKRVFDEMKELVDSLTIKVQQLQHVQEENEKLNLALEEYKHLTLLHGLCISSMEDNKQQGSTGFVEASNVPSRSGLVSSRSSMQLATAQPLPGLAAANTDVSQRLLLPGVEGTNGNENPPIGVLANICCAHGWTPSSLEGSLDIRVSQLEKEWEGRIACVEQFFRFHRMQRTSNASFDESHPAMRSCMSSLCSLNSDLASAKLQRLAEETQRNSNRIKDAFLFLSAQDPK